MGLGEGGEGGWWMGLRKLMDRVMVEEEDTEHTEEDTTTTLGPALSFWRSNVNIDDFIHRLNI